MTSYPFTLPGHGNRQFIYQPGGLASGVKFFCGGAPFKRSKGKYRLTLSTGEEIVLELKFNIDIFNPKIIFNGQVIPAAPALPKYQTVLVYLPLVLVTMGGALGGLFGAIAGYVNLSIFRGPLAAPLKVTFSLIVTFSAFVLFLISAGLVRSAIK